MSLGSKIKTTGSVRLHRFNGGINPPANKSAALAQAIARCPLPPQLILPLAQYHGAMARPLVKVGDPVHKGQLLAKASGTLSVNLHAPAAGRISEIREHAFPHASQLPVQSLVLDTSEESEITYKSIKYIDKLKYCTSFTQQEILEKIERAGIVGMGGAGFPTAGKLKRALAAGVKTLIINAAECEPAISADEALLREHAEEVCLGIAVLQTLLRPESCLIGIEDSKPEAIAALEQACRNRDIELVVIPARYPSGGERQLIQILTGLEVPTGGTPQDISILCQNVATCRAICHAVIDGQPLLSRIVTVTGGALQQPRNLDVLLGTPISLLLACCGLQNDKPFRLIHGGPMMGFLLGSADTPITPISNCIMAVTAEEQPVPAARQACIRCGFCADACPAGLLPQQLYLAIDSQQHDTAETRGLFDCIECGACNYVCPSNIPLVQYYRAEKALIQDYRLADAQAAYWQQRFEFRQLRIGAEQQRQRQAKTERMQRRSQEQTPAKATPASLSPAEIQLEIMAAVARSKARRAAQAKPDPSHKPKGEV